MLGEDFAMTLNEEANRLADQIEVDAQRLGVRVDRGSKGARLFDCGVRARGGLSAGLRLARVCLAGLAEVALVPGETGGWRGPVVQVYSDNPLQACMASQYAGWQVAVGKYFAMGSGPMRAAYGKEELYQQLFPAERPPVAVGVLETKKMPGDEVVDYVAERVKLPPDHLTLLCAPAASLAGTIQVVARSLETALHKLHELKFDLKQVVHGYGTSPLPPVAADEISAIGRTNDAILYGGQVTVWVRCTDDEIAEVGPRIPSSASPDHGAPFADIFQRYDRDFYKIDPHLFSPAVITFNNLATGRSIIFGRIEAGVLQRSFLGTA
jgi:methenyltetrahydromethanopterin cyclohydrolase